MLHSHINYEQEAQDRKVQSVHHRLTTIRNKMSDALDNDNWNEYTRLSKELDIVNAELERL